MREIAEEEYRLLHQLAKHILHTLLEVPNLEGKLVVWQQVDSNKELVIAGLQFEQALHSFFCLHQVFKHQSDFLDSLEVVDVEWEGITLQTHEPRLQEPRVVVLALLGDLHELVDGNVDEGLEIHSSFIFEVGRLQSRVVDIEVEAVEKVSERVHLLDYWDLLYWMFDVENQVEDLPLNSIHEEFHLDFFLELVLRILQESHLHSYFQVLVLLQLDFRKKGERLHFLNFNQGNFLLNVYSLLVHYYGGSQHLDHRLVGLAVDGPELVFLLLDPAILVYFPDGNLFPH